MKKNNLIGYVLIIASILTLEALVWEYCPKVVIGMDALIVLAIGIGLIREEEETQRRRSNDLEKMKSRTFSVTEVERMLLNDLPR